MTDTNQKLREACNYIDALGGDSRSYRQALALPTADHLPNAGKMINGLTQSETDASASVSGLTAAPVAEREEFEQFAQNCPMGKYNVTRRGEGYDSSHTQIMWDAWRARAALSTDDHEQSKPSVEFDLGETSSHTVKCAWSEWDAKANKLVLCLSVRDIETAAPVGERELPPIIAYRLDYPASEGVGLPRFFGADDGERAHTFAFNHKATITELCDRAALSAGDAVDAQRYRWLREQHWVEPEAVFRLGLSGTDDATQYEREIDAAIDAAMRKGQL